MQRVRNLLSVLVGVWLVAVSVHPATGATGAATDPASADVPSADFAAFARQYFCPILEHLDLVRYHGNGQKADRFMVVAPEKRPSHYVQCLFGEAGDEIYCEVASGYYADRPLNLPAEGLDFMAGQGLTIMTEGNHYFEMELDDPQALRRVADMLLHALHHVFAARADTKLEIEAPFAHFPTGHSSCVPTSWIRPTPASHAA
jgi:hypothetical protein